MFGQILEEIDTTEEQLGYILHVVLSQYTYKQAVHKFGDQADTARAQECQKLHNLRVVRPNHMQGLIREQCSTALKSIMKIKEKCGRRMKGHHCVDRRKQRGAIPIHEVMSPTSHMESVIMTSAVDAQELRYVTISDISGTFLHTANPNLVHMVIMGRAAEIMAMAYPVMYRKYIAYDVKGCVARHTVLCIYDVRIDVCMMLRQYRMPTVQPRPILWTLVQLYSPNGRRL